MNQQQLKERLLVEQCSCVIYNQGEVRIFRERGVKDLYRLLKEEPEFLAGASMADKVIGKAAAALLALGGVREVFALVISLPGRDSHGVFGRGAAYYKSYTDGMVSVGDSVLFLGNSGSVFGSDRGIYKYNE